MGRWGRDRAARAVGSGIACAAAASLTLEQDELEPAMSPSSSAPGSKPLLQAIPASCPFPLPERLCFLWMSREGIVNCGMRSGVTTWRKMSLELLPWSAWGQSIPSKSDMVGPTGLPGAARCIYALQPALIALHAVTHCDNGCQVPAPAPSGPAAICHPPGHQGDRRRGTGEETLVPDLCSCPPANMHGHRRRLAPITHEMGAGGALRRRRVG